MSTTNTAASSTLEGTIGERGEYLLPRFIRAEANLLRLPLFALHTKGLKSLDGIECRGTVTRDGQTHKFTLKAERCVGDLYPGPLARAAHLAFLSIATQQGLPLSNPISWSWYDLCRRMGIQCGGKIVQDLKRAITSTAALTIKSDYAIYCKADRSLLRNEQGVLHLYDRVNFVGSQLPTGELADQNYLWFSDWFLQNLNAMFAAPIDYELWRFLDRHSTIASRLYEFLLLMFFSGTPVLRIRYQHLAQFLPVRPERYLSLAKVQMEPALTLLRDAQILRRADWSMQQGAQIQLAFERGSRLQSPQSAAMLPFGGSDDESVEVKELRHHNPPEWGIVLDFYTLWTGQDNYRPSKAETDQARAIIGKFGEKKAKALIPLVVKCLKEQWPDAKTFGAGMRYLGDAAAEYDRQEKARERRREEQLREKREREEEARQAKLKADGKLLWDTLPRSEQERRLHAMREKHPRLAGHETILTNFCLTELLQDQRPSTGSEGHVLGSKRPCT